MIVLLQYSIKRRLRSLFQRNIKQKTEKGKLDWRPFVMLKIKQHAPLCFDAFITKKTNLDMQLKSC